MTRAVTTSMDQDADACSFDAVSALGDQGYAIMTGLMPPAEIAGLQERLQPRFDNTAFCEGLFFGGCAKRFYGLLDDPVAAHLATHPWVLETVRAILAPGCERIQINLAEALALYPGEIAQAPHRDQDMWNPDAAHEYLVNVMWPFTPYRAENGATRIWPGTQRGGAGMGDEIAAEADPGSAILFLGSVLHRGGGNLSSRPRQGLIISYCLGWLRTYENMALTYPPALARQMPPALQALIGYSRHRPNLGSVHGRCPSELLLRDRPKPGLPAQDALRPEQEEAIRAYLAMTAPQSGSTA